MTPMVVLSSKGNLVRSLIGMTLMMYLTLFFANMFIPEGGAYICPDPQCLKQAFKKKGLDRSFKIGVPESVYETLKKEMEELYE